MKIGEYRPISLVTSLYRIISKVLVERLKKVLPSIIHDAQATFMERETNYGCYFDCLRNSRRMEGY